MTSAHSEAVMFIHNKVGKSFYAAGEKDKQADDKQFKPQDSNCSALQLRLLLLPFWGSKFLLNCIEADLTSMLSSKADICWQPLHSIYTPCFLPSGCVFLELNQVEGEWGVTAVQQLNKHGQPGIALTPLSAISAGNGPAHSWGAIMFICVTQNLSRREFLETQEMTQTKNICWA